MCAKCLSVDQISLIVHPGGVGLVNRPRTFIFASSVQSCVSQMDAVIVETFSQVPHFLNHPECHLSHAAAASLETLGDLPLAPVSWFISCVISFPPNFPPFGALYAAFSVWACCHLLAETCGIWGYKVDICGMAPPTLYDRPSSKRVVLPLCQLC